MSVISYHGYRVILRPEAARVADAEKEVRRIGRLSQFDAHAAYMLASMGKRTAVLYGSYEYCEFICEALNNAGLAAEFEKVE